MATMQDMQDMQDMKGEQGVQGAVSRRNFLSGMAAAAGASIIAAGGLAAGAASAKSAVAAGTGTAVGRNGDVAVRVFMADGIVTAIDVDSTETLGLGTMAIDVLRQQVINNQTLNFDSVTGATLSSVAFESAMAAALEQAGEDVADWEGRAVSTPERAAEIPTSADVVVIGSGAAGLCAAIEAALAGKSVVVLEKLGVYGGNSIVSGAGYAAPGQWPQKQEGIEDSPEIMAQDMLAGGDGEGVPELVSVVAQGALDGMEWLIYEANVSWRNYINFEGGHTVARVSGPNGRGEAIVVPLVAHARKLGVVLAENVRADHLVREDGAEVSGVEVTDTVSKQSYTIGAGAVVVATGGFGANVEMRKSYNSKFDEDYGCTNVIGATGDGDVMVQEIGGQLVDMEYIQEHPTCEVNDGTMLSTGGIRGGGRAVLVNKEGRRFVEELERRDVCSQAILEQTEKRAYFAFSNASGKVTFNPPLTMKLDGTVITTDTLEEACDHFGIDCAELKNTIATWNKDVAAGADSLFNYRSEMFPIEEEGPFTILALAPAVHYTMGGIKIAADAAVLDEAGQKIAGLYAAGETCGDIMGTNRLGCTSYPNAVVFGRVAGASAAAYVQK